MDFGEWGHIWSKITLTISSKNNVDFKMVTNQFKNLFGGGGQMVNNPLQTQVLVYCLPPKIHDFVTFFDHVRSQPYTPTPQHFQNSILFKKTIQKK